MPYTAYVKLRTGGYQEVANYDTVAEGVQDIYSGYYRDTGWIPQMVSSYTIITVGANDYYIASIPSYATGGNVDPDEQAGTAPRDLTWKESYVEFVDSGGDVIARFLWRNIVGWSDSPPNTE